MKKYIIWTLVVAIVLLVAGGYAIREITYAQYAGAEESAQAALDGSVLHKIADVTPFTAGMNGFLITGKDELGRDVYVWAEKGKVLASQYADQGLTKDQAIQAAKQPVWAAKLVRDTLKEQPLQPVVEVRRALPAPVLPNAKTEYRTAESRYVWEVYGTLANGESGYTYLDFKSGHVLWQIALPEQAQQITES